MSQRRIVVLSGAGMSAESGIPTFRAADGLWEGHHVDQVASPVGWKHDPALVLEFYNQRRKAIIAAQPNEGHRILADLEKDFHVDIITQNIDDLHERAGSTRVMHIHGEILKSRSTGESGEVFDIEGEELNLGDTCPEGHQLRPHIVWFGEAVSLMPNAEALVRQAEIVIVVGTSLVVYPAAGLVTVAHSVVPKFIVDPNVPDVSGIMNITPIEAGASEGLKRVRSLL